MTQHDPAVLAGYINTLFQEGLTPDDDACAEAVEGLVDLTELPEDVSALLADEETGDWFRDFLKDPDSVISDYEGRQDQRRDYIADLAPEPSDSDDDEDSDEDDSDSIPAYSAPVIQAKPPGAAPAAPAPVTPAAPKIVAAAAPTPPRIAPAQPAPTAASGGASTQHPPAQPKPPPAQVSFRKAANADDPVYQQVKDAYLKAFLQTGGVITARMKPRLTAMRHHSPQAVRLLEVMAGEIAKKNHESNQPTFEAWFDVKLPSP